jgi:hypothetical protein
VCGYEVAIDISEPGHVTPSTQWCRCLGHQGLTMHNTFYPTTLLVSCLAELRRGLAQPLYLSSFITSIASLYSHRRPVPRIHLVINLALLGHWSAAAKSLLVHSSCTHSWSHVLCCSLTLSHRRTRCSAVSRSVREQLQSGVTTC